MSLGSCLVSHDEPVRKTITSVKREVPSIVNTAINSIDNVDNVIRKFQQTNKRPARTV